MNLGKEEVLPVYHLHKSECHARLAWVYWLENLKADGHILNLILAVLTSGGWFLLFPFSP